MPRIQREVNQNVDYKTRFISIDGSNNLHEYVAFDNLTLHVDMAMTGPVNLGNKSVADLQYQSSPATGTDLIGPVGARTKSIKWAHCNDSSGANVAILTPNDAVPTVVGGEWQNYTIAFWVNLDTGAAASMQTTAGFAHADGTSFQIRIQNDRLYIKQFEDFDDTGFEYIQGYTTDAIATAENFENRWNHVVITYDFTPSGQTWPTSGSPLSSTTRTGAWQIYLNGIAVATTSAQNAAFNDVPDGILTAAYIGASSNGSYEMDGKISNFMFWNKDIDESSIKAVYHSFYNSVVNYRGIAIGSGFTTHTPRNVQNILDNREDSTYLTQNPGLMLRSNSSIRSIYKPAFNDQNELTYPNVKRTEVIKIIPTNLLSLMGNFKIQITGASGKQETFSLVESSDILVSAGETKVALSDVIPLNAGDVLNASNDFARSLYIARALGIAIEKKSILKIKVSVIDNEITLIDEHVEKTLRAVDAKIVTSMTLPGSSIIVEVLQNAGLGVDIIHGLNHVSNDITKAIPIGSHTSPDIISSLHPTNGSPYSSLLTLDTSTVSSLSSSLAFSEDGLHEAFAGDPGKNVDLQKSVVTNQELRVTENKLFGPGFESTLANKDVITITVDASEANDVILDALGSNSPSMAYLDTTQSAWMPLSGTRPDFTDFNGVAGGSLLRDVTKQLLETAYVGFGQSTTNMFRVISATPLGGDNGAYFIRSSLGLDDESYQREKFKLAYIESAHGACINTFGFPSHPKFCANNDVSIDMSKFIDKDFIVEHISIDVDINTNGGAFGGSLANVVDNNLPTAYAELRSRGATFFVLCQRKVEIHPQTQQEYASLEHDVDGSTTKISQDSLSIAHPTWYPSGPRLDWSRGTTPKSVIYDGTSPDTYFDDADYGTTNGWSIWSVKIAGQAPPEPITAVYSGNTYLKAYGFMTMTTTTKPKLNVVVPITKYTSNDNTEPSPLGLSEGYSEASYLTTSESYRLRFLASADTVISNCTPGKVHVYATYIDTILKGDVSGLRVLVGKATIDSLVDEWIDIPLHTIRDDKNRKFNLSIVCETPSFTKFFLIRLMEIYRVTKSEYVDTIRDVVGWGNVGVFPTTYDEKVIGNLSSIAIDAKKSYDLIIHDDAANDRKINISFPPAAPVTGEFGTLTHAMITSTKSILCNWDTSTRSGLPGTLSDRSVFGKAIAGLNSAYKTISYKSDYKISQPKEQRQTSPYLLRPNDRLIIGVQSQTSFTYEQTSNDAAQGRVTLKPGIVRVKLYGSYARNGKPAKSNYDDMLNTPAIHLAIGDEQIRDQNETEMSHAYTKSYLDNIMYGNPNLTETLTAGELMHLGCVPSGNILGIFNNKPPGTLKNTHLWGAFEPVSVLAVCSTDGLFNFGGGSDRIPVGDEFVLIDQNNKQRTYKCVAHNGVATGDVISGTTIAFKEDEDGSGTVQSSMVQLSSAIRHVNGHNSTVDKHLHVAVVTSTATSSSTHTITLIVAPCFNSREDAKTKRVTLTYTPVVTSHFTIENNTLPVTITPNSVRVIDYPTPWTFHRKSLDFNRGVVTRSSSGAAGVTGSFQRFVQLAETETFKYDSLVTPVYDFFSMFNVSAPVDKSGHGSLASAAGYGFEASRAGVFVPIFQRCQMTGSQNSGTTYRYLDPILKLWSRWPLEKDDRRSISALNPTTFRCDRVQVTAGGPKLKPAVPIRRVQVADMNRIDAKRYTNDSAAAVPNCHYTASLAGFGRYISADDNGTYRSETGIESESYAYSPQHNKNVREDTLKALYGFETSFRNDNPGKIAIKQRSCDLGEAGTNMSSPFVLTANNLEIADEAQTSRVNIRGMRYGIENHLPVSSKLYVRYGKFGQFRDILEQRLFHVHCDKNGEVLPDRPIEIRFKSRAANGEPGLFNIDPLSTNSQNVSTFATASLPYFDDWEVSAVPSQWRYGRDRSSSQPDIRPVIANINLSNIPDPSRLFSIGPFGL